MKKLISIFKSIQLNRIFMIFLAGVLVLFSTACSRPDTLADKVGGRGPDTPGQTQSYKGGINNFNDDDSSRLNTEAATKAKALKDKVESRLNSKGVNSPGDLVDNVRSGDPGKQAKRVGDDVRNKAEDAKDSLQKFGDRGGKNLERNVDKASDNLERATDKASDKTARALNKAADTVKDKG